MNQNEEQFCEGLFLKECQKCGCKRNCCDDDCVEEWIIEFFHFHEKMKDFLISHGIKMSFDGDRVHFKDCSEGKECKFLKYAQDKTADPRPIDCKIYPYNVDWDNMDFDKKVVILYCHDTRCPMIKNEKVDKELRKEVERIIKRDFSLLFNGAQFEVEFFKDGEYE